MDEQHNEHIVYNQKVIEFIAVANEYCTHLEQVKSLKQQPFIQIMQRLLPLLYMKTVWLPKFDNLFDEGNEKIITEEHWKSIHQQIQELLKDQDEFLEVFDPNISLTDEPVAESLSENLTDIYQDLKDTIMLYRVGTNEIMNDALWECQLNFEEYWGQKLVNSLRAIHMIAMQKETEQDEEF